MSLLHYSCVEGKGAHNSEYSWGGGLDGGSGGVGTAAPCTGSWCNTFPLLQGPFSGQPTLHFPKEVEISGPHHCHYKQLSAVATQMYDLEASVTGKEQGSG